MPGWWVRPAGEVKDTPPPHPQDTLRPSSFSAPNTDEGSMSKRSISANSLIDEQSLPAWMRQDRLSTADDLQKNMPASSLIQPDSVPEWMRTLQQPSAFPSAQPALSTPPMSPLPPGFSARELIESQSLPSWMATPGGSQSIPPTSERQTFSAASLLDMDALPPWMRESDPGKVAGTSLGGMQGQAQYGGIASQAQQWSQQQAVSSPLPPSPPPVQIPPIHPMGQMATNSAAQGTLSAASFIDKNALPDWLRSDTELKQGPQAGPTSAAQIQDRAMPQVGPRPAPYGVPPHSAENVRVPSRPRGEIGLPESSEVAANVFASMLGVASAAPPFPPQGQGMSVGQRLPQQETHQGMPPAQYGAPGHMPNIPPVPPQQVPQGYVPGGYNSAYLGNVQANAPMGMPPAMMSPQRQPDNLGVAPMPTVPGVMGEQKSNTKPARRNLFEAIRHWLFRQS
jgi:hypothetical protein